MRYDLIILGSDAAAKSAAKLAARSGRRIALVAPAQVEAVDVARYFRMTEALSRAAREAFRLAAGRGRSPFSSQKVFASVAGGADGAASEPSPDSLGREGVEVIAGNARFADAHSLEVDGKRLRFRRAILATGARFGPATIDGRTQPDCLTHAKFASLAALPQRLAVIGVTGLQCAWAQSLRRLGCEVHLLGREPNILPHEPPDAAEPVRQQLEREGVRLQLGYESVAVEPTGRLLAVVIEREGQKQKLLVDQVLLEEPLAPNTADLGLDAAGIALGDRGVTVNPRLQTTNPRVGAAGAVCGEEFATIEASEAAARLCVANALGWFPQSIDRIIFPRCVWTDPQVVHVGLDPASPALAEVQVDRYRVELPGTGRSGETAVAAGFAEVYVRRTTGQILGARLVAEDAHELAGPLVVLMASRRPLSALDGVGAFPAARWDYLKRLAAFWASGPLPSPWAYWREEARAWRRGLRSA